MPELIDKDTPNDAKTRTGFDGQQYDLVFSDEFNVEGRSFYPGCVASLPQGFHPFIDPMAGTIHSGRLSTCGMELLPIWSGTIQDR